MSLRIYMCVGVTRFLNLGNVDNVVSIFRSCSANYPYGVLPTPTAY